MDSALESALSTLAGDYRAARPETEQVSKLVERHYRSTVGHRDATLLEAAAAATSVGVLAVADSVNLNAVEPQMEEAFHLAFPQMRLEDLQEMAPDQVAGIMQGWKGKYFEVIVRDKLNAGETVGGLGLGAGQKATLAPNPNHPGADLFITGEDGELATEIQLKATDSIGYVKRALERYPDIDILTTDEAAQAGLDGLLGESGINDVDLENAIEEPLQALLDGPLEELLENALPGLPLVIVAVDEGRHVVAGRRSVGDALSRSGFRVAKTGAAMGVGAVLCLVDAGIISAPAVFLTRLGMDRLQVLRLAGKQIDLRTGTLADLHAEYSRS
ncbi:hypothetical protein N9971_00230 [bacterium]|nr:hypothetical protein [bacterium]